jgi:hypothetical protein
VDVLDELELELVELELAELELEFEPAGVVNELVLLVRLDQSV